MEPYLHIFASNRHLVEPCACFNSDILSFIFWPFLFQPFFIPQPLDYRDKDDLNKWNKSAEKQPIVDPFDVRRLRNPLHHPGDDGGDSEEDRQVCRYGSVEEVGQAEERGRVAAADQEEGWKEGDHSLAQKSTFENHSHHDFTFRSLNESWRVFNYKVFFEFSYCVHL